MRTFYLLAATAASATLAASAAYGQATAPDFPGNVDNSYSSSVDNSVSTDISFSKDVSLDGTVELEGEINASSAATASNQGRQQMDSLDPEADGPDTVQGTTITGSGNIGVNIAAGLWNDQLNSAAVAVSNNVGTAEHSTSSDPSGVGGWADATTSSFQSLNNINEGSDSLPILDDESSGDNNLAGATISGTGNIGVNEVAGMFNEQANLMTLASATNSVLAEAQSGIVQLSSNSAIGDTSSANTVAPGVIGAGTSGNIGVNLAAGFANQQANALSVAASSGPGVTSGGGSGPGGGGGF